MAKIGVFTSKTCEAAPYHGRWGLKDMVLSNAPIQCWKKGDPHPACRYPNSTLLIAGGWMKPVHGCILPEEDRKREQQASLEDSTLADILEGRQ